jgi:hypothetical protein
MILPTKHLTPGQSLLGAAAQALSHLDGPKTVSQLWEILRDDPSVVSFDRFVLALDLLFMMSAIQIADGRIRVAR